jgi:hypothetical protein
MPLNAEADAAYAGTSHIVGHNIGVAKLYRLQIPQDSRLNDPLFLKAVHAMVKADNHNVGYVNSYVAHAWSNSLKDGDRWCLDGMHGSEGYYVTKTLDVSNKLLQYFFKHYVFKCSFYGLECDQWNKTMDTFAGIGINLNDKRYKMTDEEYDELHEKVYKQKVFSHTLTIIRDYLYTKSQRTAQRLEEDYNSALAYLLNSTHLPTKKQNICTVL